MPTAHTLECPQCGATLKFSGAETQVQCEYCGKVSYIPEELRERPHITAAALLSELQAAQREADRSRPVPQKSKTSPFYSVFGVLLFIALCGGAALVANVADSNNFFATPTPTIIPVNRPFEGTLPRQVRYANLQFNITRAVISNQPAALSGISVKPSGKQALAVLFATVTNQLSQGVFLGSGVLSLQLGDGSVYRDEGNWGGNMDAQDHRDINMVFRVPTSAEWKGAKLVLGQTGKEPATLALDGAPASDAYPIKVTVPGQVAVEDIVYGISLATIDLDAEGKRADLGKRFLVLALRVTNNGTFAGGVAITSSDFRLVVDQSPLAPIDAPSEALYPKSSMEGTVVFQIPAKASTMELQFGEVGHTISKVPVKLP